MASGKQTSFQFGEVSPSLRFRTDAVSYSSGLSKLKNMYVRRSGGVSNRPGTSISSDFNYVFLKPGELEYYTPEEILDIKYFTFTSPQGQLIRLACVKTSSGNRLYYNGNLIASVSYQNVVADPVVVNAPDPSVIKFTYTKDGIFVSPACSFDGVLPAIDSGNIIIDFSGKAQLFHKEPLFNVPGVNTIGASGTPPFLPASFLVTAVLKDGTEETVTFEKNASYDPATWDENVLTGKVVLPTAGLNVFLKIQFDESSPKLSQVKFFNLYRSSSATGGRNAFYKLVSKQPYDGSTLLVTFNDYGVESLAETPPLDNSFYGNTFLDGAINGAYYQQRLILGFSPFSSQLKPGEAVASKIGAPKQLIAPIIFSETGAFSFSVPIEDGGRIVNWLSMDRLIAFTEKAVYVIRGGEQGILTPTTINPLRISTEGCSELITPKMSNRRGYFINSRGTKLMTIEFGIDGNLTVYEASTFAEHLFNGDIKEIEVLGGLEDTVYVLKTDGTLLRVTCTDEGIHGFSSLKTEGDVQHIFKEGNYLMAVINRNGVKLLEKFEDRNDKLKNEETYSDASIGFGYKLIKDSFGSGRYFRDGYTSFFPGGFEVLANIESTIPGQWIAGTPMKLQLSAPIESEISESFELHFYYDDNGAERTLRFIPELSSEIATGDLTWPYEISGYFSTDLPEYFQDAKNQPISSKEKLSRQSRFAPAFSILKSVDFYPLGILHNALGGGTNPHKVVVTADGEVLSSPINPFFSSLEIEKIGSEYELDLQDFYAYIKIGIPYDCEFETLDLETGGARTITDTKKLINAAGLGLMETRGGFAGIPEQTLENMTAIVTREDESFSNSTKNFNGHIVVHIPSEWNEPGRVTIKHVDPTPISILSVYPKGLAGD